MSGRTVPATGALHGLTTWAVTTLLVLYLLTTTAGSLLGGVFSGVASAIGGVGQTVAQSVAPMLTKANPLDAMERQVRATGTDPEALNNAAVNAIRQLLMGDAGNADQARQQAAQALAQARNIRSRRHDSRSRRSSSNTSRRSRRRSRPRPKLRTPAPRRSRPARWLPSWRLCWARSPAGSAARSGVVHPVFADGVVPRRRAGVILTAAKASLRLHDSQPRCTE